MPRTGNSNTGREVLICVCTCEWCFYYGPLTIENISQENYKNELEPHRWI